MAMNSGLLELRQFSISSISRFLPMIFCNISSLILSSAKIMQTSAMKACFQIAECSLSYAKIMLNREKTMENWEKVPIVVPKVAFLGTFGTTIGTFCCVYAVFCCA